MRHYFFDSSAFVKLFAFEPGSIRVRDMIRSARTTPPASRIVMCELIHPETASALALMLDGPERVQRGLGAHSRRKLPSALAHALGTESVFTFTEVDRHIPAAAELVWKHRIRGADAVHVAAALFTRDRIGVGSEFYFVGSDRTQNAAAEAEGLDVIDPTS